MRKFITSYEKNDVLKDLLKHIYESFSINVNI